MRFKRHITLEHGLGQMDVVPLLNILFVLLIFFVLAPGFFSMPGININLPKVVTSNALGGKNVEIVVSDRNISYSDGYAITDEELDGILSRAAKKKQALLIKSDKRASLGSVTQIWDKARSKGVTQVNIATNQ